MNAGWAWFIAITTIVSLVACFWLITWSARQGAIEDDNTTGHMWDGLKELNNPLPMWWLWLFILTLIWSFGYLAYYPGLGAFGGLSEWSQSAQYQAEVEAAEARYGPLFARFGEMPAEELVTNTEALAIGQSLFANYCSQCHGSLGYGARGFPNLTDDDWLFGGDAAAV
ncbi:MAG: cbb3-type cytochrome c oxidase N-terminal domain-containing protein, partial [Pseudomonadota bacterium]